MNKDGEVRPYTYRQFSPYRNVVHKVSTRAGGVSEKPFHSLNLGFHVDDDPEAVLENRARFCKTIDAAPQSLTTAEQVHGSHVAVVEETDKGCGALDASTRLPRTDAMITKIPNIPLMVLIADCVSIGLYDHRQRAVGIVHAGWRGTADGIVRKTIEKMNEVFGSRPSEIIAGISPSIGPCCYEVGEDVIDAFHDAFPEAGEYFLENRKGNKAHLSLWRANVWQLVDAGVKNSNIETAELCTSCNPEAYYSHRAERGKTGRFGALIMLR